MLLAWGSRRMTSIIYDDESLRHGRAGVRVRQGQYLVFTEDGLEKDGDDVFLSACNGVRSGFAGQVYAPNSLLGFLVRPPVI
jgi:hypothetical protein